MTDLQELIALGPLEARKSIPGQVLQPGRRRLRDSGRHVLAGGFTAEDVEHLVEAGLDPESSSLRRLPMR
jgi:hypothetical protein